MHAPHFDSRRRFSISILIAMAALALTASPFLTIGVSATEHENDTPYVVVLGVAQDAGFPQAGCRKDCCLGLWSHPERRLDVASIAIVDPTTKQRWLIDCTPSFPTQLERLNRASWVPKEQPLLDGVLLTHAHMGHYSGLMHLGREAMGARDVRVYAMPRMAGYLESNGPWSLLVELKNIQIERIAAGGVIRLNDRIRVTPIPVPHRDEFSETVGFLIEGPNGNVAYIPDIDKWEKWDVRIEDIIHDVDVALLDGTFFKNGEIPGRDMSEIPHPFIEESMTRLADLPESERQKVRFIHLNHTNPALIIDSDASEEIQDQGFSVARQGDRIEF